MIKKFLKLVLWLVILLSVFQLYLYASRTEPQKLEVKEETLYIPHWKEQMNGLRIGVISDLHIGMEYSDASKLKTVVDLMNNEEPDIVVLLGDFDARAIAYSNIKEDKISAILKELKAPDGVYAILGNHDYEPEDIVENILKDAKILLLQNQSKVITYKGRKLKIVGFNDLWHYKLVPEEIIGKISIPVIVLSHNPDVFPEIPEAVSLTLSGHTHGGEVVFPKIGSPFVPSKYGQRFRKGHIAENNKHLYVTSGVGTLSGFRLMNPPEIVVLTINQQNDENMITDTKRNNLFGENWIPVYHKFKNFVRSFIMKK